MEIIRIDQVEELRNAMKDAREDDTPYIGIKDDEIHIQGNPNKTEVKPADYTVLFAFPNKEEYKRRAEQNGDTFIKTTDDGRYNVYQRSYKDVYLTPRRISTAISTMAQLEQFLFNITSDGEVKDLTYEEMKAMMIAFDGELSDSIYRVVASVLRIPYDEEEFMLPLNAMENAVKIVKNNPSVINETDFFFDLPSEAKAKASL